jgi:hypothetical protein
MSPTNVLIVLLLLLAAGFAGYWFNRASAGRGRPATPGVENTVIGFLTNFFDTLGIGSFATTTTVYRLFRRVDDEDIPGTLNVGRDPDGGTSRIYTTLVQVDFAALALLILAAVGGSGSARRGLPHAARSHSAHGSLLWPRADGMAALNRMPAAASTARAAAGSWRAASASPWRADGALGSALFMIMVSLMGMNPTVAFRS